MGARKISINITNKNYLEMIEAGYSPEDIKRKERKYHTNFQNNWHIVSMSRTLFYADSKYVL